MTCCAVCRWVVMLLSMVVAAVTVAPVQGQLERWSIQDTQGQYLDVLNPQQQPRLRYVYRRDTSDKQADMDTVKVFLHVFAPDGKTTLTQGIDGQLYPHHRGIFVGWSRLEHGGKTHNLWGVTNMAQVHRAFRTTRVSPTEIVVTSDIEWFGSGGEAVLDELRTHRLLAPGEAYLVLDVTTVLTAAHGPVTLGGDPEHAGLQFRPHSQVAASKSAQYIFPQEDTDPRRDLDLPWVAETFVVDDQPWTVQMMNHPENPRGAQWSAYRDYGRFGPFNTIKLESGESGTLQYRFRVTSGQAPPRTAAQPLRALRQARRPVELTCQHLPLLGYGQLHR